MERIWQRMGLFHVDPLNAKFQMLFIHIILDPGPKSIQTIKYVCLHIDAGIRKVS